VCNSLSKDADIIVKITNLDPDNEARIIVPYTYDEIIFAANTENVCLDRLKEILSHARFICVRLAAKTEAYFTEELRRFKICTRNIAQEKMACLIFGELATSAPARLKRYMK
jgi:hypothetical protein